LMLDVSRRAGVLRLLARLHEDRWLSLLRITRDLLSVWPVNESPVLSKGSRRAVPGEAVFITRERTARAAVRGGGESLRGRLAGSQAIRRRTALQTRGRCAT
jgi:hypothetical protein